MVKTAVLLLAYGGPNSLDEVPEYLRDIRGGQPVSQVLLDETTRRYRLIGGSSPLLDITRRLAAKLQNEVQLPVYVGMRHWQPRIAETVQTMTRDGIRRIITICLAPHYSPMSIGAYRAKVEQAVQSSALKVDFIESWNTQPRYIQAIAANVRATLAQFTPDPKIIFTAHSLPLSAREPYETQLRESARLIAQELGLRDGRWMLSFQSVSRTGVPWLEPQIEKVVPELAAEGERAFLVVPIGFLADHLEVMYDIDIGLQEIASANNVRVVRPPMLNDSDGLVSALAELVGERTT